MTDNKNGCGVSADVCEHGVMSGVNLGRALTSADGDGHSCTC
jgi:hypothetical protein